MRKRSQIFNIMAKREAEMAAPTQKEVLTRCVKTFAKVLCAFNAPFLSVFAALLPQYGPENSFKLATELIEKEEAGTPQGAFPARVPDEALSYVEYESNAPLGYRTWCNYWSFEWNSYSGNTYIFARDKGGTYSVKFSNDSSLAEEFTAIVARENKEVEARRISIVSPRSTCRGVKSRCEATSSRVDYYDNDGE